MTHPVQGHRFRDTLAEPQRGGDSEERVAGDRDAKHGDKEPVESGLLFDWVRERGQALVDDKSVCEYRDGGKPTPWVELHDYALESVDFRFVSPI